MKVSKHRKGYFGKVTKGVLKLSQWRIAIMNHLSISFVKATNKTNINHNNRTMDKNELRNNTHINHSKSSQNIYLIQKDIEEVYEELFSEALQEYNQKQKRNDRKIKNYYEHISNSKKTAVQQEIIIQFGDVKDFKNEHDRDSAKHLLVNSYLKFKDNNPQLHIYNAVVHMDEATPHLHINFIPVATGYKRGLEKQVSFDRAITQQDPTIDVQRPFEAWRAFELENLELILNQSGINRLEVGTNYIPDVNTFKSIKQNQELIHKQEQRLKNLETEITRTSHAHERKEQLAVQSAENSLKVVETAKNTSKTPIFDKNMIQIPKKVWEKLLEDHLSVSEELLKKDGLIDELKEQVHKKRHETVVEQKQRHAYQFADSVYEGLKNDLIENHDYLIEMFDALDKDPKTKDVFKGFVSAAFEQNSTLQSAIEFSRESYFEGYQTTLENHGLEQAIAGLQKSLIVIRN